MNEIKLINYLDSLATKYGGIGEVQRYRKYNQFVKAPIRIKTILDNVEEINELFKNAKSLKNKIDRTKSGAISNSIKNTYGCYDIQPVYNSANNVLRGLICTVLLFNKIYVFKIGRLTNRAENTMSGIKAFKTLVKEFEKDGIDITKYMDENGKEYKEMITKYPIENFILKKQVEHVYHIDLNQAWPSALSRAIPEFRKTFSRLDKTVLNSALGYCQSKYCDFKYSRLSMLGINNTNELIYDMTVKLVQENFEVVGFNTDGIWYRSADGTNRQYHDEFEGEGMDKWKTDYKNVSFYANSAGQYYIIKEDGTYEFKLRGYYQYETLKPREHWKDEEDFFKAIESSVEVIYDEEEGIIINK